MLYSDSNVCHFNGGIPCEVWFHRVLECEILHTKFRGRKRLVWSIRPKRDRERYMRAKFYLPRSSFLSENHQIHERVCGVTSWNEQSKANEGERKTKRDTVRPGTSWLSVDENKSLAYSTVNSQNATGSSWFQHLNTPAVLHKQAGTQTHTEVRL